MVAGVVAPPYQIEERERWLVARFAEPWTVVSWAVVNGGWQRTDTVAWHFLYINEIAGVEDPADWMRARMRVEGLSGAVGFMTSRRAGAWVAGEASDGDCRVSVVGTVGLSNALRAGDSSGPIAMPGTINLLVCCSQPLTAEAGMEAMALASEAKALAMLESGVRSVRTGELATGTGTDYLAMAWPVHGERSAYAGKHTPVGAAIGAAVYKTVRDAALAWVEEVERHR